MLPAFGLSPRARAVVNTAAGLSAIGVLLARGYTREELGLAHTGIRGGAQFGGAAAGGGPHRLQRRFGRSVLARDSRCRRASRRPRRLPRMDHPAHPVRTVLSEELLFRSAMSAVWSRELNRPTAQAVHALTFGLWHVAPPPAVPATTFPQPWRSPALRHCCSSGCTAVAAAYLPPPPAAPGHECRWRTCRSYRYSQTGSELMPPPRRAVDPPAEFRAAVLAVGPWLRDPELPKPSRSDSVRQ